MQHKTDTQNINTCQLNFNKYVNVIQWKMNSFFNKWRYTDNIYREKTESQPLPHVKYKN